MVKKIFLLLFVPISISIFLFLEMDFSVKALNCAADQCYWGGGGYFAEECVSSGDRRENSQARLICRNGQWKTDLNGWGCNNSSWPCDQGNCQQINGGYYCRNCVVDPGLAANAACAAGQCFWGPGNGYFTNQCVANGEKRENSWVRMICRNGVWRIDYNGWGCGGSMGFECDSGSCQPVGGYNYCGGELPIPASAGVALSSVNLGVVCEGCNPSCTGKNCGADGCGGSCGSCSSGMTCNAAGVCASGCLPATCATLNYPCGTVSDGCGGTLVDCSVCTSGRICQSNRCVSGCVPSCAGKVCGADACGGSCGSCPEGTVCDSNGQCATNCVPNSLKKCDAGNLYWYDSCGVRGVLAQNCGIDNLTSEYLCNGNWLQQGMIDNGCSNGACTQSKNWTNVQNCELNGKICKNSVCVANDSLPPSISGLAPSGTIYTSNVVLSAKTNEPAVCRYGALDVDYDMLISQFSSADKLYHTAQLVLSSFGSQVYYVRCRDIAGNTTKAAVKIIFTYSKWQNGGENDPLKDIEAPRLSNPGPLGEVLSEKVTILASTNEKASCKYDTVDNDYNSLANYMESTNNGTSHAKNIVLAGQGQYSYYVRCKDGSGNINKESLSIKFNYGAKQEMGPTISDLRPSGTIYQKEAALAVATNKVAICRYSLEDDDFPSMTGLFETVDGLQQMAPVILPDYGNYRYYVRCQDEKGNSQGSAATIEFTYKDPEDQGVNVKETTNKGCEVINSSEIDGTCVAEADCVCDLDCGDSSGQYDPDCEETSTAEEEPEEKPNFILIVLIIGVVVAVAITVMIILIKRRAADAEDADDEDAPNLF